MSVLEIRNIRAGYNGKEVLKNVTLEVQGGRGIVGIIGGNGAGKTTLFKVITGLLGIRNGSILFRGREIDQLTVKERVKLGISFVPERRQIFPFMSVFENLQMGAHLIRDPSVRQKNLEGVYGYFPRLEERSKQLAKTLSGGEQQMLAIGRAFMANPSLLLMDEPTMGLAPLIVEELGRVIRNLNETEKMEIALVEQNADLAFNIAFYVYVMEVGEIVLEGPSSSLREEKKVKEVYLGL
jgi:branched-chain amino acid transport system ATP-binding protein